MAAPLLSIMELPFAGSSTEFLRASVPYPFVGYAPPPPNSAPLGKALEFLLVTPFFARLVGVLSDETAPVPICSCRLPLGTPDTPEVPVAPTPVRPFKLRRVPFFELFLRLSSRN